MVHLQWCPMKVRKRTVLNILSFTITVLFLAWFTWFLFHKKHEPIVLRKLKREYVQVGNKVFHVWVTSTLKERTKGLMFVKHLPENEGMIFVWNHDVIEPFWMKNTVIPLTILFIKDGKVIKQMNMKPCHAIVCPLYNPNTEYNMALEINQTNQNYVGQRVKIINNNEN